MFLQLKREEQLTDYATIGRKKLREIDGEAGVQVEETLNRICPDIARYLIEYYEQRELHE